MKRSISQNRETRHMKDYNFPLINFQCNIDLQTNVLHIGTTNTTTPFLPENELPECSRLTGSPEEEAKQINETAKQLEDREIKEAIEKSKREHGLVLENDNV